MKKYIFFQIRKDREPWSQAKYRILRPHYTWEQAVEIAKRASRLYGREVRLAESVSINSKPTDCGGHYFWDLRNISNPKQYA